MCLKQYHVFLNKSQPKQKDEIGWSLLFNQITKQNNIGNQLDATITVY